MQSLLARDSAAPAAASECDAAAAVQGLEVQQQLNASGFVYGKNSLLANKLFFIQARSPR